MKNVLICFAFLAMSLSACQESVESNYEETKEYQLYMNYMDQINHELAKFHYIDSDYSKELDEAKRSLFKNLDNFIDENNLHFNEEPTELERVEFLNTLGAFIDTQQAPVEIKENVKKYWELVFNPKRDDLRNNFLKVSGLSQEQLLEVFQNRVQ